MQILFLSNLLPYPLNSGGAIHTYTILKSLVEIGGEIDFLCFKETEVSSIRALEKMCNSILQIPHKLTSAENKCLMSIKCGLSLFSQYPFIAYKYFSKAMEETLKKKLSSGKYDLIYIDHLNLGVYLPLIKKLVGNTIPIILNEHNCEYKIMETDAMQTSSKLKRGFLRLETGKIKKFERKIINGVDFTTVLTMDDYKDIKAVVHHDFAHAIIPVGVPEHPVKKYRNIESLKITRLLFVGTMTWEPNNRGMCWFLKNVMKKLNETADVELYIIGKNPSVELNNLASEFENVYVKGFVPSLDNYYDECDIFLAPIFMGSGQKVKIVEAFSRGCPVIATEFAARGIEHQNGQDILIADTVDEFIEALLEMKQNKRYKEIAENCYLTYRKYYSEHVVKEQIKNYIKELMQ